MEPKVYYCYLHENGSLICKRDFDEGFYDSPFVVMWWSLDIDSRLSAWSFLVEALSLRMDNSTTRNRVNELAKHWECTDEDAQIYANQIGCVLEKDGNMWCAHAEYFKDLQSSPSGFGETCLFALADLCKDVGYKYSKLHWGKTFKDIIKDINLIDPALEEVKR